MKIVIAPDSYKESLSALEVAGAIERGFREIYPDADYHKLPVADGGEGTVEAMVAATQGRRQGIGIVWASSKMRMLFAKLCSFRHWEERLENRDSKN